MSHVTQNIGVMARHLFRITLINKCYDEADPPYPLSFWCFLPPLEAGLPGDLVYFGWKINATHIAQPKPSQRRGTPRVKDAHFFSVAL